MSHDLPPYGANTSPQSFSLIHMLENYCTWASECIAEDLTPGMGATIRQLLGEGKLREQFDDGIKSIEWFLEDLREDMEKSQRIRMTIKEITFSEGWFWKDGSGEEQMIRAFLTNSTGGMFLPPGYAVIRQDVARKCRERLTERQITLTQNGDFSSTEEIVRWLGYGRVYDNPNECLFTGLELDADDVNPEDIIETRIFVPLLDTSDVPNIRIHRSIIYDKAWRTTREGCSFAAPHVSMDRYQEGDCRMQICHVTGQEFQRRPDWLEGGDNPGHWLIPINSADKHRFNLWLHRNDTPNGLPAEQWSTRWLQPRVAIKSIDD